jgi:hypothetical protein
MLGTETALMALSLLLALVLPTLASNWFSRIEATFSRLAERRGLSVAVIGIAALFLRIAVLPIEPIPEPIVHDEFGYLLAADTYAHGRLTNPAHPMWVHFETFSVLQKPTYQCFAQPAQGMVLALGRVVFGHPFWGVWLSAGLMCASITWMLQGWLPPEWALLGGVLAILRYGVFSYWADSYWGGAVGAIGGALVLGALPRIQNSQRIRDALWMGLGLALIANSRPYEGFIFCLPIAVVLLAWMFKKERPPFGISLRRVVLPLAVVLSLTAVCMGYYLWRVTGSPFRMPYQIERETYAVAPYMLWQHERPEPVYRHAVMRKMYVEEELVGYRVFRSFPGFLLKVFVGWRFFLGPALTVPLLMLVFALPRGFSWRDISRPTLLLLLVFFVSAVGWSLETFYNPHYSAPATGLILLLVLLSVRQLRKWGQAGTFLARATIVICALSFGVRAIAAPLHINLPEFYEFAWYQKGADDFGRAGVEGKLKASPGKHLVLVRYQPEHEPFAEWVYNEADIDHSKIVWAREMDLPENQRLIDYFKDRCVWLVEADEKPPKLLSYPSEAALGSNRSLAAGQR